jgi:hypothetical protein
MPSVGDVVRGATDVATFGTAEIGGVSKKMGSVADRLVGGKSSSYTPKMLPQSDPIMQLANSGGAQLLTNIALGTNVDDAVASHFGRSGGADFQAWYNGLDPNQQAAIDGVKKQLTQIQSNTQLRDTAVQKIVQDFPNIVSMTSQKVMAAKQAAGQEFDQATKGYLDYAMKAIAAKSGGSGTVSSGANIQASADAASKLGMDRLNYTTQRGDAALNLENSDWMNQYSEANALRSFQQKMLGEGAGQGFSAAQSALERAQRTGEFNTDAVNRKQAADQTSDNAMLGSLGNLAGTAAVYGLMGPKAAAVKSIANSTTPSPSGGYR